MRLASNIASLGTRFLRMCGQFASVASLLTIAGLAVPQMLYAQVAVEDALSSDIELRGQGGTSLCYAFSEEQMLKDFTCKTNCEKNAAEWKYSIFDIARVHQKYWIKKIKPIEADLSRDLFANGSSFTFPYSEVEVTSVRAAKCTLEKEVFYLNRSQVTNPKRGNEPREVMADYLIRVYNDFRRGRAIQPDINNAEVLAAWSQLHSLADQSRDEFDFLAQVIDFKKCNDRLPLPKVKVGARDLTDNGQIRALLNSQLRRGRSLYVGVCAEVLKKEKVGEERCGRHAVIIRKYDKSKDEFLVVDSAFFSLRPRTSDGSSWIPAEIVIGAIAKSGRDMQRILAESKLARASQNVDFERAAKESTAGIKEAVATYKPADIRKFALQILEQFPAQYPEGSPENKAYKRVLKGARRLSLVSLKDLDQLDTLFEQAFKEILVPSSSVNEIGLNGIVWLDPK